MQLNELPELVLLKLFDCLPMCDGVNSRRVCKLWRQLADEGLRSRSELVVFYKLAQMPLFWCHSNKPVDLNNALVVNEKFEKSQFFAEIFKNIRSLCIASVGHLFFKNESLQGVVDRYSRLEHFQLIDVLEYIQDIWPSEPRVYSKSLQTLFLGNIISSVEIHCPGLKKLSFYRPFHLTTDLNPLFKSLEFLEIQSFSYARGVELPNLKTICFCDSIEINIAHFKSLQEIHFFYCRFRILHRPFFFEPPITTLNGLLEQKRVNGRVDLEFYYDGFPYRDDPEFREFVLSPANGPQGTYFPNQISFKEYPGPKTFSDFARWIRNSKIENTSKSLWYYGNPDQGTQVTEMVNRMDETTSEKFSRSIATLYVKNASIKYAKELRYKELFKYVKNLILEGLPQKVLDLLPEIVPNVVDVTYHVTGSDMTNCKFLLKFKSMTSLEIDSGALTINEFKEILDSDKMYTVSFSSKKKGYFFIIKDNYYPTNTLLERLQKKGLLKNEFYERFFEFNYNLDSITFEDYYLNYD